MRRRKAMRWRGLVTALLLLPVLGRADFTILQQVEGGGTTAGMQIRLQGAKMRTDLSPGTSMIIDGDSGETIFLQHRAQTFSRVSAEEARAMAERVGGAKEESAPGELVATGDKKMIGTHLAELYSWTIGAMKMRLWISPDFPNGRAVQQQFDRLQQSGLAAATAHLMPPPASLPGLRLRTEMELKGQKVTYTILSVKEEPLAPSHFAIPPGYRETPFAFPAKPTE